MDLISYLEKSNRQYGLTRPPIYKKKEIEIEEEEGRCFHYNIITHTTGSVQCLRCKEMLKVIEPKWKGEKYGE